MVKTPKVSPLSNRGVRCKRTPGNHNERVAPWRGAPTTSNEQQGMPGVGALFQSATTL